METKNSYTNIFSEISGKLNAYTGTLSANAILEALQRTGLGMANMPQLQNARVKAISSLPADYTKDEIAEFLKNPYASEKALRETSIGLKWTTYTYYKMIKTYQDIPTDRYFAYPAYLDGENASVLREFRLVDKLNKALNIKSAMHRIRGEALTEGKVFYTVRYSADKRNNKINYAFMQKLPSDWCKIIGFNNVSGYTVSFNLFYFLQPGTDVTQFGDLFTPYMQDFYTFVSKRGQERAEISGKAVFAERKAGNPKAFMQNGRWFYYVSLPVDRVWTFEIDDTTAAAASPFSGLMLTLSQQADFEAAQLSLVLNPLLKIFTGELPYYDTEGASKEDTIRLSNAGMLYYLALFNNLMRETNTGGTAMYFAPAQNIKSHDFPESANANQVSESFLQYGMEKAGLAGLIPVSEDVNGGQVGASRLLEGRFSDCIYRQFESMMNAVYRSLGLKNEFLFQAFGTIYNEKDQKADLEKAVSRGDLSAYFYLCALEGVSVLDKLSMIKAADSLKINESLKAPPNAYTQGEGDLSGRPETDGITSEGKEKYTDAFGEGGMDT